MTKFEQESYRAACDPKLKGRRIQVKSFQLGADWGREYERERCQKLVRLMPEVIAALKGQGLSVSLTKDIEMALEQYRQGGAR